MPDRVEPPFPDADPPAAPGFKTIAVLGGGLLGGSLALALAERCPHATVRLWARRDATVAEATQRGIRHATTRLAHAVAHTDLAVLAVPVGSMAALTQAALDAGLPPTCLVTDVGSVKQLPHDLLEPLLFPRQMTFIGSHPMAGSEQAGIAAASPGLFENAACLLTTTDSAHSTKTARRLEQFWQAVGCRTSWLSPGAHDALVARISHLPHILAASGANVCLTDPSLGPFGGGGLRDTTRVAAGLPEMWAEILTENRQAILGPLRESIADLTKFLAMLEASDHDRVRDWLTAAKQRRDSLNPTP